MKQKEVQAIMYNTLLSLAFGDAFGEGMEFNLGIGLWKTFTKNYLLFSIDMV